MSNQKRNIEAANLLANRGRKLKKDKPYDALIYFSRTLGKLYHEESKEQLVCIVMEMADIFQDIGLFWASRNYYYYAFVFCLNQYFKYGKASRILYLSAHALKYIELRLGHILHATVFHRLACISEHIYPGDTMTDDDSDNFDYALAIQLFRTPFETTKALGMFPAYLDEQGLAFSRVAMKYELGYYDETMLADLDNNTDVFDDVISKWKKQPALKQMVNTPWYGVEKECLLQTKVLGCSIRIKFSNPYSHGEFEYAATILATIESFLGSGLPNHLISLQGKIDITLCYDHTIQKLICVNRAENDPTNIEVTFRDYDSKDIINEQKCFTDCIHQLLADVISVMFMFSSEMEKIERMIKNDAAFVRAGIFANSIFFGMEVLGKDTFSFPAIVQDYPCLEVLRREKSTITSNATREIEDIIEPPKDVVYELPPDADFKKVSNTNIHTSSIVNSHVWNLAKWKGVLFMADMYHIHPPVLSFVFETEIGKTIFEEWQKTVGDYDAQNQIGIRIIKGIDQKHPFWYRVAIGPSNYTVETDDETFIISMPCRLHTMQPNNNANLKMFEEELKRFQHFYLCPSYMPDRTASPETQQSLMLKKRLDSIIIYDACDIPMNDYLAVCAIIPTDDPIIPVGKENSPVVEIMRRKKKMQ